MNFTNKSLQNTIHLVTVMTDCAVIPAYVGGAIVLGDTGGGL